MALLVECPMCHQKQPVTKKKCAGKPKGKTCGHDLDKAKQQKKTNYWERVYIPLNQRGPEGKPYKWVCLGKNQKQAHGSSSKVKAHKAEDRPILDILPGAKITWKELTDWYLKTPKHHKKKDTGRVERCLANFNEVFGESTIRQITLPHLEAYQDRREADGLEPRSIDYETDEAGRMIKRAWEADKIDDRALKVFTRLEKRLRKGSNIRKRVISVPEYTSLLQASPEHLRAILVVAYNTGMRPEEMYSLEWKHIDKGFIRLPAELTKTTQARTIPINHHVQALLDSLPRPLRRNLPVLTYQGKRITHKVRKSFMTACKDTGIPYGMETPGGVVMRDTRRSVDTHMVAAGVLDPYRKTIIGHVLEGMDRHYVSPSEDDLKGAMDIYTAWLDGQIEGQKEVTDAK